MEEAELGTSKSSQYRVPFPPYRRSHLRSQTVDTLLHILSHLSASTTPTSPLNTPENGDVRMGQENEEMEPECSEFVGSDFTDPKDPVSHKEILKVHENIEGNGDKGKDFSANEMVLDDIELLMGMEETSTQANGSNNEQKLMAELEMVVNGIDDLVCDNGLIPLNSGLGEKQNDSNEVELMDYQVEHVEFLHPDVDISGNPSKLQVSGDNNQAASEGFHPPLTFHAFASTMGQASASLISTPRFNYGSQQQETELLESVCAVVGSLPGTEEGQFEKEEQDGLKVAEATHISLDLDTKNEVLNMSEDGGLMDSTILEDKYEVQNEGEKLGNLTSVNNVTNSNNFLIEKGNVEQGEISGEQEMLNEGETLGKLICTKNAACSSNILIENGDLEEGEISGDFEMDGDSFDISFADMPTNLTQNKVLHKGFLEESQETTAKEHGNSSAVKIVSASRKRKGGSASEEKKDNKKMAGPGPGADEEKKDKKKQLIDASTNKKRGPGSKEKKARNKMNNRKKRAEKNRELGVKRLKLLPVQKEKTIKYCRHYLYGRCNEGDKCQFSHDTVPKTKSKPCHHFARHSCMKGDDCPYDHELSKYPCNNFVSSGSCWRGDTCMFSHQVPANQDIPTPSNVCKPQSVSQLNNHGFSSIQQNHLTNSKGTNSLINADHNMVADISQKQPTLAPKGIRFINAAKLSPSPSTQKQCMVTPNKESPVQHGTLADRSASGATQNMVKIPKKLPSVAPKGINFLSFGKGPVCCFKSSIGFHVNSENGIKLPQVVNFGLPHQASPSLNKDGSDKVSDGTKNVPQTDLPSNEILNKVLSVAEGVKSKFPGKASKDDSAKDNSHSKSVQEEKKASNNSSGWLVSGYHKLASRSSQRALSSTLAFAAEHESDINMKLIVGGSDLGV